MAAQQPGSTVTGATDLLNSSRPAKRSLLPLPTSPAALKVSFFKEISSIIISQQCEDAKHLYDKGQRNSRYSHTGLPGDQGWHFSCLVHLLHLQCWCTWQLHHLKNYQCLTVWVLFENAPFAEGYSHRVGFVSELPHSRSTQIPDHSGGPTPPLAYSSPNPDYTKSKCLCVFRWLCNFFQNCMEGFCAVYPNGAGPNMYYQHK